MLKEMSSLLLKLFLCLPYNFFHASAMIVFANLTGANIVVYNIELNTKNIVQIKIVIGETSEQFRRHRSYYQTKSK